MTSTEILEVDVMFVQMKEILKLLNSEMVNKIPEKIRNYIINYESKGNYKFIYDTRKSLNEQNLTKDTRNFIAYLDYYYWASDDERKEINKIWDEKESEINKEKTVTNSNIQNNTINLNQQNNNISQTEKIVATVKNEIKQGNNTVQTLQNATIQNNNIIIPKQKEIMQDNNITSPVQESITQKDIITKPIIQKSQKENNKLTVKSEGFFAKIINKIKAIFGKKKG